MALNAIDAVGRDNGLAHSTWSVDGVEAGDFAKPHPHAGATHVVYTTDSFFGGEGGNFTMPIEGNTWLDLWKAADAVIGASGDAHHRFIESFTSDHSPYLTLNTGS
jgi:hypothetical protein